MENIILNQMNALIMNINDKYWRKNMNRLTEKKRARRMVIKRRGLAATVCRSDNYAGGEREASCSFIQTPALREFRITAG